MASLKLLQRIDRANDVTRGVLAVE